MEIVLIRLKDIFIYLPALLWTGGLLSLIPENAENKTKYWNLWKRYIFPISFLIVLLQTYEILPSPFWASFASGIPLFVSLILLIQILRTNQSKPPLGLALIGTIMFGLSVGLFLPTEFISREIIILAIGLDFIVLGIGIAIFDAFDEGHSLRSDMLNSLQSTFFIALLFGGQVVIVINLSTGLSFSMLALLLASLTTAILSQTFFSPIQNALNKFNPNDTAIRQEQLQLRTVANTISRLDTNRDIDNMSDLEFNRLTRKAISYLGDLPRLASSPLTRLPIIDKRLIAKQTNDTTLARTNELKLLLNESIQRLKPQVDILFGTTDEWRYYNALYFPYVVGIKPSRRRQALVNLEPHVAQALEWFQVEVPERTLHNWQNTGAQLVAQDLKDQISQ